MTGFARRSDAHGAFGWTWEVRSVNGRGLDLRSRLPLGYESLEAALRPRVEKWLTRGSVSATLRLDRASADASVVVNEAVLEQFLRLAKELQVRLPGSALSIDGLLAQRGVVEMSEAEGDAAARAAREAAMLASFDAALDDLVRMRGQEGERLAEVMTGLLGRIEALVGAAGAVAALQPLALLERLRAQVVALGEAAEALPQERLAQEVALLVLKADVREELDRLTAHIAAARELLAGRSASGRRLDFLAQEFNREANTLLSKSSDLELTRLGLELKAMIDQFREQAQNIE
jgi:uncharacterized protein (TIGR00255 family)